MTLPSWMWSAPVSNRTWSLGHRHRMFEGVSAPA
ncbi:Uncharacterised protein [Mycobacteroides abscessus]|nr:Uncharacterised protein [Mycobacteroides abscessus]